MVSAGRTTAGRGLLTAVFSLMLVLVGVGGAGCSKGADAPAASGTTTAVSGGAGGAGTTTTELAPDTKLSERAALTKDDIKAPITAGGDGEVSHDSKGAGLSIDCTSQAEGQNQVKQLTGTAPATSASPIRTGDLEIRNVVVVLPTEADAQKVMDVVSAPEMVACLTETLKASGGAGSTATVTVKPFTTKADAVVAYEYTLTNGNQAAAGLISFLRVGRGISSVTITAFNGAKVDETQASDLLSASAAKLAATLD